MSERNGSTAAGTGTAEIPIVRPAGPETAMTATPPAAEPVAAPAAAPEAEKAGEAPAGEGDVVPGMHATAPVSVRPKPRMPRRGPLTVMGPWAPVAGGLLGILLGMIAVLVLAGAATGFEDRLALVFVVLGLGMLGSAGVLLADEVRMMRQRARDAVVRPAYVEVTAGLLNGLTPGRLLLLASGFVFFLAAYVSR
ncbi:hypothetical protein [Blastococcus saxobsidens]|uniref:Uncharacterized protein n=1 Tax=Blastococcus saxobsidens (strain DD2) TaxID=1146883 RepID=H6RVN2_BLASD|nr:hypothetical protein [Blastococcus saxobsidens]CCG03307.1 conserved membrane protein of unknown function [Blastococcus saxobsidens DD2]